MKNKFVFTAFILNYFDALKKKKKSKFFFFDNITFLKEIRLY